MKGKKLSRKRTFTESLSDSESDHPKIKMSKIESTLILIESAVEDMRDDVYRIERKVDSLKDFVDTIKVSLDDMVTLNDTSSVPFGLQKIIRDSFQCKICLSIPMNPPVIMSKC